MYTAAEPPSDVQSRCKDCAQFKPASGGVTANTCMAPPTQAQRGLQHQLCFTVYAQGALTPTACCLQAPPAQQLCRCRWMSWSRQHSCNRSSSISTSTSCCSSRRRRSSKPSRQWRGCQGVDACLRMTCPTADENNVCQLLHALLRWRITAPYMCAMCAALAQKRRPVHDLMILLQGHRRGGSAAAGVWAADRRGRLRQGAVIACLPMP